MKRFLRLIYNELKVLRISVAVAAITLTFFTASLFSVLNVYFNLSDNIFDNLDKNGSSLSISAGNITVAEQKLSNINGSFWGHKNNVTRNAVLTNAQNKEFHTEQRIETDGNVQLFSYSGVAYIPTDKYLQQFKRYSDYIEGTFPRQPNEVCLCNYIATELGVTIGDTIRIGADDFIVSAIYDETLLKGLPNYFICVDDNFLFDNVNIELATSVDTYHLYNKLLSNGIVVQIPAFYDMYIDGISATNGFLFGISLAIFIANIIIIYAMFSMIVINRKKHICRMITLGASNATIFEVFYLLSFGIVTVVNVIAYGLSNVFGKEIIGMCSTLFEMEFTVARQPLILLVYTVINMLLLLLMYFVQIRSISQQTVLESIKGE